MYIEVEKTDCEGSSYLDHLECEQHLSRANSVLRIGGVLIPLCQTCIDELYEEILPQVSAEVLKKNAQG